MAKVKDVACWQLLHFLILNLSGSMATGREKGTVQRYMYTGLIVTPIAD